MGGLVAAKPTQEGFFILPARHTTWETTNFSGHFSVNNIGLGTDKYPGLYHALKLYTPSIWAGFGNYSVAYQYNRVNFGTAVITDETGHELGTFEPYEVAHTISAAYDVNNILTIGAGINRVQSELLPISSDPAGGGIVAKGLSFDLGVLAKKKFEGSGMNVRPTLGFSISDLGKPVKYIDATRKDPLPMMLRLGAGVLVESLITYEDQPTFQIGIYGQLAKLMSRREDDGSAMGPFKALFNAWDSYETYTGFSFETVSLKDQIARQWGFEITGWGMIQLRYGRIKEHELAISGRNYHTYGASFMYKYFSFDYAGMVAVNERITDHDNKNLFQLSLNIPLEVLSQQLKF